MSSNRQYGHPATRVAKFSDRRRKFNYSAERLQNDIEEMLSQGLNGDKANEREMLRQRERVKHQRRWKPW